MRKEYVSLPNAITSFRIIGAILIIFIDPKTASFFMVYALAGLSDAIDGFVARKTNSVSEFGSKLDSVADLLFYSIMFFKMLPYLKESLSHEIWYCVGIIFIMRIIVYLVVAIRNKEFHSPHTYLNKASGFMMYLLPFVTFTKYIPSYAWALIGICAVAAIDEVLIILFKKNIGESLR
ncbi:MAG: CDP-alcohol phosphatidyltransferase family protein [Erysipelotrichaceae bacterium]|nr:CDP-alcohol phosphatidyltransferase family protein [Erysipelotrichaceae bacterium]